ncbi:3-oxoacyl-(acyl-carrier-protein) reductase [Cordyceps javanica]|uniref:3-oxoacyl-(Acyl-carrier-protein) reductase n=1 Tax=Cordyceps javanica TaxID=43265 RepID=A0A545UZ46_9HYPO|nr:3-oxoacyl-(acyl-carrier-protein) reductase [Cordyceps javanica]TQW06597.1 3-oxoacyl-(acyl-carrier-protein) reductase [Cordyceps javanica]
MSSSKVWLITGCSSGLGREIALAALARGDTVVATARDPAKLADLGAQGAILQRLDVTDGDAELAAVVDRILARTGGAIDILVNNAGYILTGAVEECSRDEVQATFGTNVFGQLNVARAVLPVMRRRGRGTVANLGSVGGWHGTPGAGLYCATKACAALLSEALRLEVAHLGIRVTCVEPGYLRTPFLAPGHRVRAGRVIADLAGGTAGATIGALDAYDRQQPGDPAKAAALVVEALTDSGRAAGRALPPRLVVGRDAYEMVTGTMDANRADLESWKDLTTQIDHDA